MRPVLKSDGTIKLDNDDNPTDWEILPFEDDGTYNCKRYTGTVPEWKEYMYQDIGNMTTNDYRYYQQLMLSSISNKTV